MENREKLEIPSIEFTPVTLLSGSGSTVCSCDGYTCTSLETGTGLTDKDFR